MVAALQGQGTAGCWTCNGAVPQHDGPAFRMAARQKPGHMEAKGRARLRGERRAVLLVGLTGKGASGGGECEQPSLCTA